MSCIKIALAFLFVSAWVGEVQAAPITSTPTPGQNFDLSSYRLQTLDTNLQFKEIVPVGSYQDRFFFTDPVTGAMIFRVPSGAGHSKDSEFPRVELRENRSWTMDSSVGRRHSEAIVLQVLAEPKTGELIFAQIHGEKTGGSEALKMRWSHGEVLMGVKKHYGDDEERISLLRGLSLGDTIECHLEFDNGVLTVHARSGNAVSTRRFDYAIESWRGIPLYYKAGIYSQDKDSDGSVGRVAVKHLDLAP